MEYLTLKQAAEASDTSYATIRRDIENGHLPAYKVGRKYFITAAAAAEYGERRRALNAIEGYTIRQLMEILPLSYAYIIELIKSGRLPAVKRGRSYIIARTDLQRFIEEAQL
ncbi:MAG: helix-turn-helix domain-containing protein [Bacillota bacterium]|nr:helix-turn-helix domain-containing protein [Bacillota bacterium]